MRHFVVAAVLIPIVAVACGDDDGDSSDRRVDPDGKTATAYLADLEAAGLGDLYSSDEEAVAYVATACDNAGAFGMTPQQLIESGTVSAQAAVALEYCDTELAG